MSGEVSEALLFLEVYITKSFFPQHHRLVHFICRTGRILVQICNIDGIWSQQGIGSFVLANVGGREKSPCPYLGSVPKGWELSAPT